MPEFASNRQNRHKHVNASRAFHRRCTLPLRANLADKSVLCVPYFITKTTPNESRSLFALAVHNSKSHTQVTFSDRIDIGSAPPTADVKVADLGDQAVSASSLVVDDVSMLAWHLRIERGESEDELLKLTAFGELFVRDELVEAESELEVRLPLQIRIGKTSLHLFEIEKRARFEGVLSSLDCPRDGESSFPIAIDQVGKPPSALTLNDWFNALGILQRQAAGSREFFDIAAKSVVDPGGLDAGMVLLRDENDWNIRPSCVPSSPIGITLNPGLLEEMLASRCTVYHSAASVNGQRGNASLKTNLVESVVASPLFDMNDDVVGAVYGARNTQSENQRSGIRTLEAQWIQLVAEAVSGGIVRLAAEADAARTRVLFEQVFSPQIVAELERNPDILNGQQRELTVLFADLRGFTATSERLGPGRTFKLLAEVMNTLTEAIHAYEGVVIDYYGDGLCAMWNAPTSQSDHATLACRAALKMQQSLPEVSNRWRRRIQQPLRLGVGIHTGMAQVGNAGSRSRLKYGPRGPMVNLASRLETATKSLSDAGDGIVISSETKRQATGISAVRIPDLDLRGVQEAVAAYRLESEIHAFNPAASSSSDFAHLIHS